jgi:hypothetical protein
VTVPLAQRPEPRRIPVQSSQSGGGSTQQGSQGDGASAQQQELAGSGAR